MSTISTPSTPLRVDREQVAHRLTQPLSEGYRPTLPQWALYTDTALPQLFLLRDIELMMIHPVILNALDYYKGGIGGAEFDVTCNDKAAGKFSLEQCQRYWDRGVPLLQGGYEYGWMGAECLYCDDDGPLRWDGLIQFNPRDTFLLTRDSCPVGVRVKNIFQAPRQGAYDASRPPQLGTGPGEVNLWLASDDVPAKGLWYPHRPRWNNFYGQSQLLGAWRPWRRLAWRDGAETVLDMAFYRLGYHGPVVRYPDEDLQGPAGGAPNTTFDSQGNPRRFARDIARQMAEQMKAGAAIGMPSGQYPPDMGGGEKWSLDWPDHSFNGQPIIDYCKHLHDQLYLGIGVPPELVQASEVGSGYSGRAIPLEAFVTGQQRIADALLTVFLEQVLRPLVRWNFGPRVRVDAKVKSLLETKRKQQGGQEGQKPPEQGAMPTGNGLPGQRQQGTAPQKPGMPKTPPVPGSLRAVLSSDGAELVTDRIRDIARRVLARRWA